MNSEPLDPTLDLQRAKCESDAKTVRYVIRGIVSVVALVVVGGLFYTNQQAFNYCLENPLAGFGVVGLLTALFGIIWNEKAAEYFETVNDDDDGDEEDEDDEDEEEEEESEDSDCEKCGAGLEIYDPKPLCASCAAEVEYYAKKNATRQGI